MLRIKDNVDLKELEKFGFVYDAELNCWDYRSTWRYSGGLETSSIITIYEKGKELYCSMIIGCNEPHYTTREIKIENILFDLIQAGIVEKVEE